MLDNNYYNSIEEMPLYNWRKCQEHGELFYCRKDLTKKAGRKVNEKLDNEAWDEIYDTFLLEFGLGKDMIRIFELRLEIAELECDLVITENRFLINQIERLKQELKDLIEKPVENDMDDIINYIEMWRKIEINENTVQYIDKQLDEVIDIINEIESELEKYKEQKAILNLTRDEENYFPDIWTSRMKSGGLTVKPHRLMNLLPICLKMKMLKLCCLQAFLSTMMTQLWLNK